MFSIKKLFGKDDKFYDLLEVSADEANISISFFASYMKARRQGLLAPKMDTLMDSRRRDKKITQQISHELAKTFVTPIEREDIDALSRSIYRIPKAVEKIVERMSVYNGKLPNDLLFRQVELLEKAVEAVVFMVKQLRHGTTIEKVNEAQDRLQWAEGEADKVMQELIRDLYNGPYDAKELVILQDFYEMIEKIVDRCRDCGNVVIQIVLKYS